MSPRCTFKVILRVGACMVTCRLALLTWCAGYLVFCEGGERAKLASPLPLEEATCAELHPTFGSLHLGQEEIEEDSGCNRHIAIAPRLEPLRHPSAHPQKVSDMPNTERTEIRTLPILSGALEQSMEGASEEEIAQQERSSQEERQGASTRSGERAVGGLSIQCSMDTDHAINQIGSQIRRNATRGAGKGDGKCANPVSSSNRPSQRRDHVGGGQEEAQPPSWFAVSGCRAASNFGIATGSARGQGEGGAQYESTFSWTPQQVGKGQSSGICTGEEDRLSGQGMGCIRSEHVDKNTTPCGVVSAVQRRDDGDLQHEVGGVQTIEAGIEPGIAHAPRSRLGGAYMCRDHQCGRADAGDAYNHHIGRYGRTDCGPVRRGRCHGDSRKSRRWSWCQGQQDPGEGTFSWCNVASESCTPASEGQEGQGQGQNGQVGLQPFAEGSGLPCRDGPGPADCTMSYDCEQLHSTLQTEPYKDRWAPPELSLMTLNDASFGTVWRETMRCFWKAVELNVSWMRCDPDVPAEQEPMYYSDFNCDEKDGFSVFHAAVQNFSNHHIVDHGFADDKGKSLEPRHFDDGASSARSVEDHGEELAHACGTWYDCSIAGPKDEDVNSPLGHGSGGRDNSDPSGLQDGRYDGFQSVSDVSQRIDNGEQEKMSCHQECRQPWTARAVSFADEIDLFCFSDDGDFHSRLRQEDWQQCCRSLWHEHGQIAAIAQFEQVLGAFSTEARQMSTGITEALHDSPCPGNGDTLTRVDSFDTSALPDNRILCNNAVSGFVRPVFAATWFLARDRFPLCVRSRKLQLLQEFWESGESLIQKCRDLWRDLDDGTALQVHVVEDAPHPSPTTNFHIVILQGETSDQDWTLFHSILSPALYRLRAVMFPQGSAVNDFFRFAQVGVSCPGLRSTCFLRCTDDEGSTYWHNEESFPGTRKKFVEGGIRSLQEDHSDDDGSDDEFTDRVTTCPGSSDEECEELSFMQSSESIIHFQFDDEGAYP